MESISNQKLPNLLAQLGGLKQLDWVARRIFRKNLLSTRPADDLVPKVSSLCSQCLDQGGKVIYLNDEAIPAPWLRDAPVRRQEVNVRPGCTLTKIG